MEKTRKIIEVTMNDEKGSMSVKLNASEVDVFIALKNILNSMDDDDGFIVGLCYLIKCLPRDERINFLKFISYEYDHFLSE